MQSAVIENEKRIRLAESLGVVARVAVLGLLLAMVWKANGQLTRVEQTHALLDRLEVLRNEQLESSALHRAYLLTGDSTTHAAAELRFARSDTALREIRPLLGRDSAQQRRLQLLDSAALALAASRRRDLQQPVTVETGRAVLLEPARVALRTAIAAALDSLIAVERTALRERREAQLATARLLFVLALIAVIVAASLGLGSLALRRRHAVELTVAEANFRHLAEANPDAVYVVHDDRVVYANAAMRALLGAAADALTGRSLLSLIHPDDRELVNSRVAEVLRTGVANAPRAIRYLRTDGSTVEVEGRCARIVTRNGLAAQVVLRDLTVRREAEAALQLSEARFRTLLDAMEEGVVLHNTAMEITLWNPAAERILRCSGDMLSGRTSYDPTWRAVDERGHDLPGDPHVASVVMRSGRPVSGVMGITVGTAEVAWIRVNAVPLIRQGEDTPYAVVATFADITAERAALERVRESEGRYRMLAENGADLISRWSVTFDFEYASPSHLAVLGWTPEELLGRSAMSLVHADDLERLRTARTEDWAGGRRSMVTLRVQHKDGRWVWLEIAATRARAADGRADGYLVSARDVTARLALEDELRQSQKMEVMGRMASGVAHDFNNLLTVIRSSTELMRLELQQRGTTVDGLTDIEDAAERATALTAHLLTFSRRQHYAPARLQLAAQVHDTLPILKRLVGPDVAIDLDLDDAFDATWVWADPVRFEQVLVNLVSNAKDAMPDGGTVRIRCEGVALPESVTHRFGVIRAGHYVTLTVEDTGTGMTDDVLSHLFDPFYTTKPQGRGTGLGLSIVYGVVTEALGTVTVLTAPGRGSRLTVYWPRAEPAASDGDVMRPLRRSPPTVPVVRPMPAMARRPTPRSSAAVAGAMEVPVPDDGATVRVRRRILLVDDDDSVRRVIARQLEAIGHAVVAVGGARAALALLQTHPSSVAAVITDVRMPEMTGVELVDAMIACGIDLPVLLISGQMDSQLPGEWPEVAHRRFLAKPISGMALRQALDQVLHTASAV